MEKLYDKYNDLIYLFSYNQYADVERYIDYSYSVYINQKTGKLISKYTVNTDPMSMRYGAISSYYQAMTYEQMKCILAKEKIKGGEKFESLCESNWEAWLIDNRYV